MHIAKNVRKKDDAGHDARLELDIGGLQQFHLYAGKVAPEGFRATRKQADDTDLQKPR